MKKSLGDKIFDISNAIFMLFVIVITIYPFWYVLVASLSDSNLLLVQTGILWKPIQFTIDAYRMVVGNPNILTGYRNTLFVVILGTIGSTFFTAIGAYVLSRKPFPFKRVLMVLIVVTMYFGGGIIPRFILINDWLKLGDSRFALILPYLVGTYNLIVLRTGFEAVPSSLEESAYIDGANDWQILFKIIIPVSMAAMAVIVLFYAVSYWNAWFNATIYIRTREKFPLQVILREILIANSTEDMSVSVTGDKAAIGESIKYATVIVSTVPILLVYPFVQKYFVKGTMIGAIKG